jgi:RHS repeat-associated protein
MLAAAKDEGLPLFLAALPLSQNSPPALGSCDPELHQVIEFANSLNASGLAASLYDEGTRSRSTGKERDSETGLDFFGARYYGSALGRFTSPDWSAKPQAVPYADFSNPQSLNLYAYVQNNPLKNRDLDGHICIFGIGNTCTVAPPPPPKPPAAPTNPVYGTVDQAGVGAAKADKKQTDARRASGNPVEYGNSVYTVAGVAYTYTDPVTSNKRDSVNPNKTTGLDSPPIPDDTALVGEAHSHSDIAVDADGNRLAPRDQLSFQDRNRTLNYPDFQKQFQAEYVALPDGAIIKYDVHNQTTVMK